MSPIAGRTATTPGLELWGSGQSYLNVSASNVDLDGNGTEDQILASTFQNELDAQYRGPWSIGAGGSFTLGRSTIRASAEWFSAVDEYDIVDIQPFIPRTGGEPVTPEVKQGLKSIVNMGAGIEFAVTNENRLYLSLVSDRSALGSRSGASALISTWDIRFPRISLNYAAGGGLSPSRPSSPRRQAAHQCGPRWSRGYESPARTGDGRAAPRRSCPSLRQTRGCAPRH